MFLFPNYSTSSKPPCVSGFTVLLGVNSIKRKNVFEGVFLSTEKLWDLLVVVCDVEAGSGSGGRGRDEGMGFEYGEGRGLFLHVGADFPMSVGGWHC